MVTVMIGIDPHKRSNTALVLDGRETVLARRRFANDGAGYRDLKAFARAWKQRTWAVEGDLQARLDAAGPEGHSGATLRSSASDPTPMVSPSDQSLTGPATKNATPRPTRVKAAS